MKTKDILQAFCDLLTGLKSEDKSLFSTVAIFDSDNPDQQAEALQDSDGRFCLVAHNNNAYQLERKGRQIVGGKSVVVEFYISNSKWVTPDPDAVTIMDVVDTLTESLLTPFNDAFTVTINDAGRYSPQVRTGQAAGRIIYHFQLTCQLRESIIIPLSR